MWSQKRLLWKMSLGIELNGLNQLNHEEGATFTSIVGFHSPAPALLPGSAGQRWLNVKSLRQQGWRRLSSNNRV